MSKKVERFKVDKNIILNVYNNKISISIQGVKRLAFVNYTKELFEIVRKSRFRIHATQEEIKDYKYLYFNEYKKYLHQIVFDYYFGEDIRKKSL